MDTIHVKRNDEGILGIGIERVPEGTGDLNRSWTDKVSRGETKRIGDDDVEGMYGHGIVMR